jgi:CRP/FNR family transcriptional regulator
MCLPSELLQSDTHCMDELVYMRRSLRRGDSLYRAGDPFRSLYAVQSGFFKISLTSENGRDQVTGFHMAGEIIGLDGIGTETHSCSAVSLEDSEVCVIPFSRFETLGSDLQCLRRHFHRIMSREIVREHGVMLLLGTLRSEERLAAFLLDLSQRFLALGSPPGEFHLRMTREDIGSFLGLKLETVSRIFSKFIDDGLIEIRQRCVRIVDLQGLKRVTLQTSRRPVQVS